MNFLEDCGQLIMLILNFEISRVSAIVNIVGAFGSTLSHST